MNDLISVIVPVYKVEKYLNRCVDSIVNQTYKNLEIILVDDGSPDNCPAMCDEWAERDSRIKVLHIENNGAANARNQGLNIATGDYIGFADSDDWTELDMFETLLINLKDKSADISVCNYGINDLIDNNSSSVKTPAKSEIMKLICFGDYKYGMLWNKLYKRELIDDIRLPLFACSEDLTFNYFVFKKAKTIVDTDRQLYHYFQNETSIVHNNFALGAFDAVKAKETILEDVKNTELEPYAVKGLINSCFVVISGVVQNNRFTDRYSYLRNYIVKNRKTIYSSSLYSKRDKFKTFVLTVSPRVYNKIIIRKKI